MTGPPGDKLIRTQAAAEPVRQFLPYEIALGDGEFARLVLPRDLTKAEADRLCGVIQALAFGETP